MSNKLKKQNEIMRKFIRWIRNDTYMGKETYLSSIQIISIIDKVLCTEDMPDIKDVSTTITNLMLGDY